MLEDTQPDAYAARAAPYHRMSGERRVALMFVMSEEAREISLRGCVGSLRGSTSGRSCSHHAHCA